MQSQVISRLLLLQMQMPGTDMSGYGAGYGTTGLTGYEDPNAAAGYGAATGEARLVCSIHYFVYACCVLPVLIAVAVFSIIFIIFMIRLTWCKDVTL